MSLQVGAWSYAYDLAGNLTTQTDARGCETAFAYDALNRLTGKTYTGATGCAHDTVSYAYDQVGYGESLGRRTTMTDTSGTTSLAYDAENRLISATVGAETTQYVYDGDGTLVAKVAGGQTTVYVGPHYEKNLTTDVVTKCYILGEQRVAMRVGAALTYLLADHLGSASLTTDANGAVLGEMRYFPYGQTRWITGTVGTDRRPVPERSGRGYTGQREEASTQLHDYNARYYDPLLGRFLQADTGNLGLYPRDTRILPGLSRPGRIRRVGLSPGS